MIRLRYKKVNNELRSNPVLVGNEFYIAVIEVHPEVIKYDVRMHGTDKLLTSGVTHTTHAAKKLVKNQLKNLGYVFGDEIRKKISL